MPRSETNGKWRSLLAIAVSYTAILALIAFARRFDSIWLDGAAIVLIAALQNHLQILFHEGAHFHLHRARTLNDLICDILCGLPFFNAVELYRPFHFAHHRHLLDPGRNPEIPAYFAQGFDYRPRSSSQMLKLLFLDLCGYHFLQYFFATARELIGARRMAVSRSAKIRACVFYALTGIAVWRFGIAFAVLKFWFGPQATLLFFLLKLQGYGEHRADGTTIAEGCWVLELDWPARFFLYPLNAHYHREHHLEPALPWYRLPAARARHPAPLEKQKARGYFIGPRALWSIALTSPRRESRRP